MSETSIVIKKVKYSHKAEKIAIVYERQRDGHSDELSLLSDEEAAPEFYAALEALTGSVCNILEISMMDFKNRITPYGVTFHYDKDDVMGAMISFRLDTPIAGDCIHANTPMRKCAPDDTSVGTFFSRETTKALWEIEHQAQKYISGHRAQVTLFDENGNAAAAADADDPDEAMDEPLTGDVPLTASTAHIIDFPQPEAAAPIAQ